MKENCHEEENPVTVDPARACRGGSARFTSTGQRRTPGHGGFHGGVVHSGGYRGFTYGKYHAGYTPNYNYGYRSRPFLGYSYPYYGSGYYPYYNSYGSGYYPYYSWSYPTSNGVATTDILPSNSVTPMVPPTNPEDGTSAGEGATPAATGSTAQITFHLPSNATLWIDNTMMNSTGAERMFVTPTLTTGQQYTYEVHVRWLDGDTKIDQTRKIMFSAGDKVDVQFPAATAKGPFMP